MKSQQKKSQSAPRKGSSGASLQRKKKNGKMVPVGNVQQIIANAPNLPLPTALRLRFTCEADYKIAIATASTTSGAVKLNSPWLPFRPGGSSAFGSYTFLGPATEATLLPTGWSNLANANLYKYCKVIRSTLSIRLSGANSGNNVVATVFPADSATSVASIYTARTMPYSRQATFSVSKENTGCDREGWFTCTCDPYKFLGENRSEAKADLATLGSGSFNLDPLQVTWWHVYLQSNDLDVSATTASLFQVRVMYDVELYGMQQMSVT